MKVGVIGTGNMGENHVKTYLAMKEHCQLVGIYDNDPKQGRQISDKYTIKQFQSLSELLRSVDAVSIVVPTEYHYEIGLRCIENKVHIFMEKPITDTVDQALDLIEKAEKAGVKLQVGHIELFNPLIQTLAEQLSDQTIIELDFHRMSPYNEKLKNVDVVKDLMIHDLYILQSFIKQDKLLNFFSMGQIIENTPKHASVLTKSEAGVIAKLTASFKSKRKVRTIQILTEDALIEADILNNQLKITRDLVSQELRIHDTIQPLQRQLTDFIECIRSDRIPTVTGYDGVKTLQKANEISKALHQKQF
ncbi:Gfo/Idh/MocA family oxidoreductase [Radiobacillus deserti]|uniref:Gfo/Idh/MocA family oxidoreductase n=2 Tax=Radiobacillus deserti TaxID=2594883 RepID=A0A516KD21_9BACI|nr:Gfo/Idh/MocA family oxidoreductase [Radiobacillus deserti]